MRTAIVFAVDWQAHMLETLDREGFRRGGARAAVVEVLAGESCCLSAQEIHDRLRAQGRKAGIASVYRVLELLASLHLVQKVDVGGGVARFERHVSGGDHHHHIVCDRCGKVALFEDARLESDIARIAGGFGYRIEGHDVVLRGVCADCAAPARRAGAA